MKFKNPTSKHFRRTVRNVDQIQAIRTLFTEFCSSSSIHGVRYFAERNRHWSERLWWLVAISVSVWLCGASIRDMWIKWHENPVTMSFTEKYLPISSVPFPTVTVCSETKVKNSKLNVDAAYYAMRMSKANMSDEGWARMRTLAHLCTSDFMYYFSMEEDFVNGSIYEIMKDMAPPIEDVAPECRFNNVFSACDWYLKPILTDEGLCFTFNALNSNEVYTKEISPELNTMNYNSNVSGWNLENGYKNSVKVRGYLREDYPVRVFNVKGSSSLIISIRMHKRDFEYSCRGMVPGVRIFLYTPGDKMPTIRHSIRIPLSEEVQISVQPKMITTSKKLYTYKPSQRQCFFNSERKLYFFKTYTQNNCEAECLSNYTEIDCGCVKFSMPRKNSTKICGSAKISCYQLAEMLLFGELATDDGSEDDVAGSFREKCNCLPACTSILYNVDVDRAKLNYMEAQRALNTSFARTKKRLASKVEIFFRDPYVITVKRIEMYSYTNFLAICGGLLGLFLGISTLSIVEFIYYLTLRLYWSIRQWNSDNFVKVQPFKRNAINSISSKFSNNIRI